MKKCICVLIAVLVVLLGIWGASLIEAELLTDRFHSDFEYAYAGNSMLGEMEYFKVLECDGMTARVYYVSKGMAGGDVLTFEKQDGAWAETGWETIWSKSGSASGTVYPYWWHFIYGGL